MSAEPALRLVSCEECERLRAALDAATTDIENLQADLKRARRENAALKRDRDDKARTDPNFATAERLFDFWRAECKHPNAKLGTRRQAVLLARLAQYTPREIAMAIRGAAVAAYVDPRGVRHDDLELICRDEVKLENFIDRYERWKGTQ